MELKEKKRPIFPKITNSDANFLLERTPSPGAMKNLNLYKRLTSLKVRAIILNYSLNKKKSLTLLEKYEPLYKCLPEQKQKEIKQSIKTLRTKELNKDAAQKFILSLKAITGYEKVFFKEHPEYSRRYSTILGSQFLAVFGAPAFLFMDESDPSWKNVFTRGIYLEENRKYAYGALKKRVQVFHNVTNKYLRFLEDYASAAAKNTKEPSMPPKILEELANASSSLISVEKRTKKLGADKEALFFTRTTHEIAIGALASSISVIVAPVGLGLLTGAAIGIGGARIAESEPKKSDFGRALTTVPKKKELRRIAKYIQKKKIPEKPIRVGKYISEKEKIKEHKKGEKGPLKGILQKRPTKGKEILTLKDQKKKQKKELKMTRKLQEQLVKRRIRRVAGQVSTGKAKQLKQKRILPSVEAKRAKRAGDLTLYYSLSKESAFVDYILQEYKKNKTAGKFTLGEAILLGEAYLKKLPKKKLKKIFEKYYSLINRLRYTSNILLLKKIAAGGYYKRDSASLLSMVEKKEGSCDANLKYVISILSEVRPEWELALQTFQKHAVPLIKNKDGSYTALEASGSIILNQDISEGKIIEPAGAEVIRAYLRKKGIDIDKLAEPEVIALAEKGVSGRTEKGWKREEGVVEKEKTKKGLGKEARKEGKQGKQGFGKGGKQGFGKGGKQGLGKEGKQGLGKGGKQGFGKEGKQEEEKAKSSFGPILDLIKPDGTNFIYDRSEDSSEGALPEKTERKLQIISHKAKKQEKKGGIKTGGTSVGMGKSGTSSFAMPFALNLLKAELKYHKRKKPQYIPRLEDKWGFGKPKKAELSLLPSSAIKKESEKLEPIKAKKTAKEVKVNPSFVPEWAKGKIKNLIVTPMIFLEPQSELRKGSIQVRYGKRYLTRPAIETKRVGKLKDRKIKYLLSEYNINLNKLLATMLLDKEKLIVSKEIAFPSLNDFVEYSAKNQMVRTTIYLLDSIKKKHGFVDKDILQRISEIAIEKGNTTLLAVSFSYINKENFQTYLKNLAVFTIKNGNRDSMKWLVDNGLNPNITFKDNVSLLQSSLRENPGISDYLISLEDTSIYTVDKKGNSTLHYATLNPVLSAKTFQKILAEAVRLNETLKKNNESETVLDYALKLPNSKESREKMVMLIKQKISLSEVYDGEKIVQDVLKEKPSVFSDEDAVLVSAYSGNQKEMLKRLKGKKKQRVINLLSTLNAKKKNIISILMQEKHDALLQGLEDEKFIDLAWKDNRFYNLLMQAVEAKRPDLAKSFIKKGIETKYMAPNGATASMLAAENGLIEVMEKLMVDAPADELAELLRISVGSNQEKTAEKILDRIEEKIDKDALSRFFARSVGFSPRWQREEIKKRKGISFSYSYPSLLEFAAVNNNKKIVKRMLKNSSTLTKNNGLKYSAPFASKEMIEILAKDTTNDAKIAALNKAVLFEKKEAVKTLLEHGADAAPLLSGYRDEKVLTELFKEHPKLFSNEAKLLISSYIGDLDKVKEAIEKGTSVETISGAKSQHVELTDHYSLIAETTALMLAAENGHTNVIEFLINKNAEINKKNKFGRTALMNAASKGHTETAKFLIDKGALAYDVVHSHGDNALIIAAGNGHLKTVKFLSKYIDVNLRGEMDKPALIDVAMAGQIDVVRFLLSKGVDINSKDNRGDTALMEAARVGRSEIVKLLIEKGADVNATKKQGYRSTRGDTTALIWGYLHGEVVELLAPYADMEQKMGALDLAENGRTFLRRTSKKSVEVLLKYGADITPFFRAEGPSLEIFKENPQLFTKEAKLLISSYSGDIETVKAMLDEGVDINMHNNYGSTPLHFAALGNHKEIVKLLVERGADVNTLTQGETPLLYAVSNGNVSLAKFLLRKGAEIGTLEQEGFSSFIAAAEKGHSEMIEFFSTHADQKLKQVALLAAVEKHKKETALVLLRKKTNAEDIFTGQTLLVDIFKENPQLFTKEAKLLISSYSGDIETTKRMLKYGVNPDKRNMWGENPLMLSAINGNEEIVDLLLKNGADINAKTRNSKTALMFAIEKDNTKAFKTLISNNADITLKDQNEKTALFYAAEHGRTKMAEKLLELGANPNNITVYKRSPLISASLGGYTKIVELLLRHGADVNHDEYGETALVKAIKAGNLETVKLLSIHIKDKELRRKAWKAFEWKKQKNSKMVSVFLESGFEIPPNLVLSSDKIIFQLFKENPELFEPNSRLSVASKIGDMEQVRKAMKEGAVLRGAGRWESPLFFAATGGNLKLLKFFVRKLGKIPKNEGEALLMGAIWDNKLEIVDFLIKKGMNLNNIMLFDSTGSSKEELTPIMFAAKFGRFKMVKFLVNRGADIKIANEAGFTALMLASLKGHPEIVKYLLEKGADVNRESNIGHTPLHSAVVNGNLETVLLLLENGAKIDSTALAEAAEDNHTAVVWALLEAGADIDTAIKSLEKRKEIRAPSQKEYVERAIKNLERFKRIRKQKK